MNLANLIRLMENFTQKETQIAIYSLLQKRRRVGLMFTVTKISIGLELLISILLNKKQRPMLL